MRYLYLSPIANHKESSTDTLNLYDSKINKVKAAYYIDTEFCDGNSLLNEREYLIQLQKVRLNNNMYKGYID